MPIKENIKAPLCKGNSPVTGEFPAQGSVTRKMFPFGDVIMTFKWSCIQSWSIWNGTSKFSAGDQSRPFFFHWDAINVVYKKSRCCIYGKWEYKAHIVQKSIERRNTWVIGEEIYLTKVRLCTLTWIKAKNQQKIPLRYTKRTRQQSIEIISLKGTTIQEVGGSSTAPNTVRWISC